MSLCRRNCGRQRTLQLQMCSRTRQSSQGSPGQIKPARESRYYVESASSIELNVNKGVECVAVSFIRHGVAKALKHRLDASDAETFTCKNAVYQSTLKPCNLAVTVQRETLLIFILLLSLQCGKGMQINNTKLFPLHPDHPLIWQKGFVRLLWCRVPAHTDSKWV